MMTESIIYLFIGVLFVATVVGLGVCYSLAKKLADTNKRISHLAESQRRMREELLEFIGKVKDSPVEMPLEGSREAAASFPPRPEGVTGVQQLQQQTQELRDDLKATAEMSDAELMAWIDRRMDETRLFTTPGLEKKKLASLLGLTQKRLQSVVKQEGNHSNVSDYLTEKRFVEACRLLREQPDKTIEAICAEAGFQSRRTFHNTFKEKLNLSPSQYRQSQMR